MFIVGSCKALNLTYSGCCLSPPSPNCRNGDCFCDYGCHSTNDCCSDIADIGCHFINKTLGKAKSHVHIIN